MQLSDRWISFAQSKLTSATNSSFAFFINVLALPIILRVVL